MGEDDKKGGRLKKLFLLATIAGLVGAMVSFIRRRRQETEDSEWQELPPPTS